MIVKNIEKQQLIIDFCLIIKTLFPKEIITHNENEYYQNLLKNLPKEEQYLTNLLIHHLTKLYQTHRINRNKRIVEIAEEDILTALQITGEIINPQGFLTKIQRAHFIQLQLHFNQGIFSSKQASKILYLKRTQTFTILKILYKKGLLKRVNGSKNKGYNYQILNF